MIRKANKTVSTKNKINVMVILSMVESQIGSLRNMFLRKKASALAIIIPRMANASEKKLSLLVARTLLSTSTILYKKRRLNNTQMIATFSTR